MFGRRYPVSCSSCILFEPLSSLAHRLKKGFSGSSAAASAPACGRLVLTLSGLLVRQLTTIFCRLRHLLVSSQHEQPSEEVAVASTSEGLRLALAHEDPDAQAVSGSGGGARPSFDPPRP